MIVFGWPGDLFSILRIQSHQQHFEIMLYHCWSDQISVDDWSHLFTHVLSFAVSLVDIFWSYFSYFSIQTPWLCVIFKNYVYWSAEWGRIMFYSPPHPPHHPSSSTHRGCLEQLDSIFTDFKIIAHLTCSRSLIFSLLMRAQLYVILCNPMDCSPPDSPVHGIFQAKLLKWVAISYSRESLPPRDRTHISCIGRWILYHCVTWEAKFPIYLWYYGKARAFVCKV